mmetsp:Transcript_500/g.554  ORF Transcript_500/g.554 Transcript_500/m.554 type:complete len:212 (-) Transcript_500:114-749(-)
MGDADADVESHHHPAGHRRRQSGPHQVGAQKLADGAAVVDREVVEHGAGEATLDVPGHAAADGGEALVQGEELGGGDRQRPADQRRHHRRGVVLARGEVRVRGVDGVADRVAQEDGVHHHQYDLGRAQGEELVHNISRAVLSEKPANKANECDHIICQKHRGFAKNHRDQNTASKRGKIVEDQTVEPKLALKGSFHQHSNAQGVSKKADLS